MPKRMTEEELNRHHDGLCGISIGDGDCSCLVSWVRGLQTELDTAERTIEALEKTKNELNDEKVKANTEAQGFKDKLFNIVGIMQGSGLDEEVFAAVFSIANEIFPTAPKAAPAQRRPACGTPTRFGGDHHCTLPEAHQGDHRSVGVAWDVRWKSE